MGKLLIKNATAILPMTGPDQIYTNADLAIEGNHISFIGAVPDDFEPDSVIDGRGKLVMPGLINCHNHAAMTLLRCYADDLPLMEWLQKKIWPVEAHLNSDDVYWGSLLACAEMVKSGTTLFADMYFEMGRVAEAAQVVGIRTNLSRGMIGFGPNAERALNEAVELVEQWHCKADGMVKVMLGPHAPYTCPPEYLERVMKLADEHKVGIHIHLAETKAEVDEIKEKYGTTPVKLMDQIGLFHNRHVLAAHCVHLTDEEMEILASRRVGIAHNPESNMKLASGIAPVPRLLELGAIVGLGTDGPSSNNNLDMFQEMRSAALLHKVATMNPTVIPAYTAIEMATVKGAQALGYDNLGQLKPGYLADMILIDLEKPHLYPRHDLLANLVYAAQASDVDTVIVNGHVIMTERKLLFIDENEVLERTQAHTDSLLARAAKK